TETTDVIQNLVIPDGIISINGGSTATVSFEVRAYESRTIEKSISVLGLAEGLTAEFSSDTVEVTVSGPQGSLEALTEAGITVEIDLSGLEPGEHEITPEIGLTENIGLVSTTPETITVIIRDENEIPPEENPEEAPPEEETPTNTETP
ncbi:MAG: hypothetical protein EOM07_10720, partial [Clostridia bacterium]|nr:hypothetical protein [Clostridia bacterium]